MIPYMEIPVIIIITNNYKHNTKLFEIESILQYYINIVFSVYYIFN
jgi:hypothetical protein